MSYIAVKDLRQGSDDMPIHQKRNHPLKMILALLLLAAVAVGFWVVFQTFSDKPETGSKTISVTILSEIDRVDLNETVSIRTDAEYLKEALEEKNLIEGEDGSPGFYVTTVNGVLADESQQEFWCLYKNGEMSQTGVDTTVIQNGDQFSLILQTW